MQRGGITNVSVNCILKGTAKEKALVLFSASIKAVCDRVSLFLHNHKALNFFFFDLSLQCPCICRIP